MFSRAMSEMYRQEVPQYGTLIELVETINREVLDANPTLAMELDQSGELARLDVERHQVPFAWAPRRSWPCCAGCSQ